VSNPAALFPGHAFILYVKNSGGAVKPLGGFSDSVGLLNKLQSFHNVGNVTMKRGIVNSGGLSEWISAVGAKAVTARREVIVTQRGVGNIPLKSWKLTNAVPRKYVGPSLGGNSNDVALEELVLSTERIELIPPH